ncbi:hypothetical protein ACFV0H_02560 [Streptomyces erythrochromogenes]|uniref:hypothetical protein n=1 Tax=Streptomyces erythrochromogenes TaxID=285574 RepID=UPI0036D0B78A
MLAQAAEYVPGSGVLASGFAAEQKFDGHRPILFAGLSGRLLCRPGSAPWFRTASPT